MVGEGREAGEAGLVESLLHPAARTTRQQRPLCGAAYGSLCALSSGNMSSRGEHVRPMMAGGSGVERAGLCLLSIGERLAFTSSSDGQDTSGWNWARAAGTAGCQGSRCPSGRQEASCPLFPVTRPEALPLRCITGDVEMIRHRRCGLRARPVPCCKGDGAHGVRSAGPDSRCVEDDRLALQRLIRGIIAG